MRRLFVILATLGAIAWSGAAWAIVVDTTPKKPAGPETPGTSVQLTLKDDKGKTVATKTATVDDKGHAKFDISDEEKKKTKTVDMTSTETSTEKGKKSKKTYEKTGIPIDTFMNGGEFALTQLGGGAATAVHAAHPPGTTTPGPATTTPITQTPYTYRPDLGLVTVGFYGGGSIINRFSVDSEFNQLNAQGGGLGTIWGLSLFANVGGPDPVWGQFQIGGVLDWMNAPNIQTSGTCGSSSCLGNISKDQFNIIAELREIWQMANDNSVGVYVGFGGSNEKLGRMPTGLEDPAFIGHSQWVWAVRGGVLVSHYLGNGFSADAKFGYQWNGDATFPTTDPLLNYRVGTEGEYFVTAGLSYRLGNYPNWGRFPNWDW
jgi:hypothetical protein